MIAVRNVHIVLARYLSREQVPTNTTFANPPKVNQPVKMQFLPNVGPLSFKNDYFPDDLHANSVTTKEHVC